MFFPSPVDSVRECLRVLKPGGRIALAVWHFAERNPFHYNVSEVVERYVDSPPPDPDAPDTFRFAKLGKLQAVLSSAGVAAPSDRLIAVLDTSRDGGRRFLDITIRNVR